MMTNQATIKNWMVDSKFTRRFDGKINILNIFLIKFFFLLETFQSLKFLTGITNIYFFSNE